MKKLNIVKDSAKVLVLYHGTSDIKANKVKTQGLESSVESSTWYMLSSHKDDAIFHIETVTGNPVVIQFEVPYEDVKRRWKGFPYLWPSFKASGGFKGEWYALKKPLPPKFIKKIIKISPEELKKVKG
jgi:hypothetical protein